MKFSEILSLIALLSSTSALATRQLCGEDYCNCFTGPGALGFDTQEECIAYAKANDYPEWLRKREVALAVRQDGDKCRGFATEEECDAHLLTQDETTEPSNTAQDNIYSSVSERDDSGGCDNKPDLCLTFITPSDSRSFAVPYGTNISLDVLVVGSSQVRANADPAYDLTRCFFSGSNYPALDSANQPPQRPDIISQRPAVLLAQGDYNDLYDIGPPQDLLEVQCPSPATS